MRNAQTAKRSNVDEGLTKSLQQLGFTDHETRAYLALNDGFPATAYEVAQRSGLPRANAYSVLGSLAAKGAVQEVMRDPVKYAPVDPKEYFGAQAKQTAALCESVTESMSQRAQKDEHIFVWAYRGASAVTSKITELIANASTRIWVKGPIELLRNLLPDFVAAAKRKVNVTLIVFGDDAEELRVHERLTVFLHEGRGTNRGASKVVLTITTDGIDFMIASYSDDVQASFGRNQSIVYVVETMILHEIYLAEMYEKIGPMLDDLFEEHFGKLRRKYRPPTMGLSMLQHNIPTQQTGAQRGKPGSLGEGSKGAAIVRTTRPRKARRA